MLRSRLGAAATVLLLLQPLAAGAVGIFKDVPDDHQFREAVEYLVRAGVVHGNPDGKFYPDRKVNRAEFLKMAYLAAGRTPKAIYAGCFSDVQRGSWYEAYVCDAAARENGFVQGYADKKFKPENPVTRTEALKILFLVLGLDLPNVTEIDKDVINFVDISTSAWYSKYLSAAYNNGVLPIAGQESTRFYPEREMLRGQAAAYLYNGLQALLVQNEGKQPASSSSSSSAAAAAASSAPSQSTTKNVVFPFKDEGQFTEKKPVAYMFELKEGKTVMQINATVTGYYNSSMSCRLYLLEEEGFTSEYYLGMQEGKTCAMTVAARPGKYQLQVQPTVASVFYSLDASATTNTDGNDGFMEAVTLTRNKTKPAALEPNEYADWFTFTLDKKEYITIEVTGDEPVICTIYTPKEFDQFGFAGPQCGAVPYELTAGTYTVGIMRKQATGKRLTYIVHWK